MSKQQQNGSVIAIVTMFFLYAMISFVTNLGAPIGVIWKNQPEIGGSNVLGIMGNFMNFFAYLFMGIPAGKMLTKVGYKKTALIGIAVGFFGVLIQYLSGFSGGIPGFCIYLFGAFISGFSVCILNTVVNPMLNLLGGGGNRGNQLNMIGGTLNSLSGTMTPMLVGALIGTVTASTKMADVNLVMFIAMAVFACAFIILLFIPIEDPEMGKVTADTVFEHSPWSFRHTLLGVIAIFVYVGVEVGRRSELLSLRHHRQWRMGESRGRTQRRHHWWCRGSHVLVAHACGPSGIQCHRRQGVITPDDAVHHCSGHDSDCGSNPDSKISHCEHAIGEDPGGHGRDDHRTAERPVARVMRSVHFCDVGLYLQPGH